MSDIARFVINGRLTKDAELKYVGNKNTPVSRFSLAINDYYAGKETVNFFNFVLWGKLAESLHPYLKKGKLIGTDGRPRQNRWTDNAGNSRRDVEFVIENIQLLGGSPGQGGSNYAVEKESQDPPDTGFDDDIPF